MAKIAVVYYSSTGNVHQLALAIQAGAEEAGADVRLRRAPELAPAEAIASQEAWQAHHDATKDTVAEATNDDLEWADGLAFGTPTRYGLPTAQLKQFIDQTGPLWGQGKLNGKLATSFTSAQTTHGGLESTLLALNNVFYHWGCLIVPPGYADAIQFETGTPYGASHVSGGGGAMPESTVKSAHFQGRRLAEYAAKLAS